MNKKKDYVSSLANLMVQALKYTVITLLITVIVLLHDAIAGNVLMLLSSLDDLIYR